MSITLVYDTKIIMEINNSISWITEYVYCVETRSSLTD